MGLFDHLFKPRPEGSVERIVEAPLKASGMVERSGGLDEETDPDPATAFLQPKGYAAAKSNTSLGGQDQGFVPVLPSAKRPPVLDRRARRAETPVAASNLVVLTVGDVLSRIPTAFLRPGPHDLKRELRFQIEDLASDITRGRPAIALSFIAEQCPELFHTPISDADDMAIRLPLQKLVEQAARLRPLAPAPSPALPPTRPQVVAPAPVPVVPPVEKRVKEVPAPIPAAPGVEKPVVVERPAERVRQPPVIPAPLPPPPAVEISPPPPPPPPPDVVAPAVVEREPEPLPAVPVVAVAVEPPREPEPVRSPEMVPPGSVIELGLAALIPRVPPEMIVSSRLPPIDDSHRITLPFPMIERQLGTGSVEIPARLFWTALPPLLKHHFLLRDDLVVELPLEEIFQNLPVAGVNARNRFEPLARPAAPAPRVEEPIVLAPAPPAEATPELDLDLPPSPAAPVEEKSEPPLLAELAPLVIPPVAAVSEPPALVEPAPVAGEAAPLARPEQPPAEPAPVAVSEEQTPPAIAETAASAAPAEGGAAFVHLQPFRVFTPPSPAVEPEVESEPLVAAAVVLDDAPAPSAEPPHILPLLPPEAESALEPETPPAEVEASTALPEPEEPPSPHLAAMPPPEPAPPVALPEPEPLVAFNPDQPPPLKIEEPAAAVAVLRATLPAPAEEPAAVMATTSVQPPRMFRPIVLPPPIAGFVSAPAANLTPTLAGSSMPAEGMISLAPAPEAEAILPVLEPAPPPPPIVAEPEPAALAAVPPTKNAMPRFFPSSLASAEPEAPAAARTVGAGNGEAPVPPPAALIPPAVFAPAASLEPGEPLHLPLPPLPQVVETPAPPPVPAMPALPISRLDQHSLQTLFMTDESLDLPKISRLAAALPGLQACTIVARGETFSSGLLPEGFHLNALRGLSPQVGAAADRLPIGDLKNFTLYGEQYSVSFFERPSVCLCAIHRERSFIPGVREKLVAVVDELARAK